MTTFDLRRRLAAEALGTAILVATVVGSGIMATQADEGCRPRPTRQHLADRRHPRGADPDLRAGLRRALQPRRQPRHGAARAHCRGARSRPMSLRRSSGGDRSASLVAHLMFDMPLWQASHDSPGRRRAMVRRVRRHLRARADHLRRPSASGRRASPVAVGLYITAAYWFTASTSFANPAVTIARALHRHLRRHRARERARLHRGAGRRRLRGERALLAGCSRPSRRTGA